MGETINIFLMYTKEDSATLLQLLHHLDPIKKDVRISFWYDDPIDPVKEWSPQIISRFEDADVYLFLMSNTFMHSKFIEQVEFKMVIDRYKAGKSKVIPLILENCPWDINFEAKEYTFNFNELQVLPEEGKPIKTWNSTDRALSLSTIEIKKVIASLKKDKGKQSIDIDAEKVVTDEAIEDQLALSFAEEVEAKKRAEEEVRTIKEIAAQKAAEEQKRSLEGNQTKEEVTVKEIIAKEVEATQKALAEKKRLAKEVKAEQKELERRRLLQEAESKKRIEEENRLKKEIEEKRKVQEEKELRERLQTEQENLQVEEESYDEVYEVQQDETKNSRKKILFGAAIATLAVVGIVLFSLNTTSNEAAKELPPQTEKETIVVEDSNKKDEPNTNENLAAPTLNAAATMSKSDIGDKYLNGIIFEIDENGKTGKIAHLEDVGPMIWRDAIKIHEQLGEGWRLPTLEELRQMRHTIGQGATNTGEFTDELYWSATPFDANQARLVRFSDGNTSYHYNSRGTHREFLVRAIRDFSQ